MLSNCRLVLMALVLVLGRQLLGCSKEPSQCICVPDGHNEKGEQELLCTGGDQNDPFAPCILKNDLEIDEETE